MILNNSRGESFDACKQKAYFEEVEQIASNRTAQPLLVGSGFHAGLATINSKSGTLDQAADLGESEYRKRANWDDLLKEERTLAETDIRLVRNMIKAYGEHYQNENYTVLAPEISFRVALPNTEHHCWQFHRLLEKGDLKFWQDFLAVPANTEKYSKFTAEWFFDYYHSNSYDQCSGYDLWNNQLPCLQPHYLVGTTDAIIQWNRAVWLQEHKTTAYDLYNDSPQSKNWINNWALSTQASTYIYGVWKSLGIRPHGVLVNVVIKPRSNAVNPKFSFYREAFLRTEEHLLEFEKEVSLKADDYEYRMRTGRVWKNPHSCFNYNRRCDFHKICTSGTSDRSSYVHRHQDYVNAAYYKVLGLEPPVSPEPIQEEVHEL